MCRLPAESSEKQPRCTRCRSAKWRRMCHDLTLSPLSGGYGMRCARKRTSAIEKMPKGTWCRARLLGGKLSPEVSKHFVKDDLLRGERRAGASRRLTPQLRGTEIVAMGAKKWGGPEGPPPLF